MGKGKRKGGSGEPLSGYDPDAMDETAGANNYSRRNRRNSMGQTIITDAMDKTARGKQLFQTKWTKLLM